MFTFSTAITYSISADNRMTVIASAFAGQCKTSK